MTTLLSLLTACVPRFWERPAPERTFTPEELLIDEAAFPPNWHAGNRILPVGDDMVTHESVCQGFSKTNDAGDQVTASHCVYRQVNRHVAGRSFEHVYLPKKQHKTQPHEWNYESPLAQQSFFGCSRASDGSGQLACEWGAQYEEYIVRFQMGVLPGEASLEAMETAVRAIDSRMTEFLASTPDDSE